MEVCPLGNYMLGTSWAQMEICPAVVDCDQMPQEVFYEDDGSPCDNICPAKDESWKVPLQNDAILFPFVHKSSLKLQSIPQNVNQVLQR